MMKRCVAIVIAWMLLTGACALAEVLTDAPGTPTQDVVLELTAAWRDEANTAYDLHVMPADKLTMDTVTDIFKFVYEEGNRPARYFPEETQRAIEQMVGIDIDILHMTEFMRLHAEQADPQADLEMKMLVDVDYYVGQLIVVVLGDTTDPQDLVWTPVESRVTQTGLVECLIPEELMEQLQGEDVLFSLLTVREGSRGTQWEESKETPPEYLPSKTADDSIRLVQAFGADGKPRARDFRIIVVNETDVIIQELAKIQKHIREDLQPACTHLPAECQNEFSLLMGEGFDIQSMPVYEYLCLITEDYRDTDGDGSAMFAFATPYFEGQKIVTALGLPKEDADASDPTLMDWLVQRADVKRDGTVEVIFDQLALIKMGEETALMLMFSEPLSE